MEGDRLKLSKMSSKLSWNLKFHCQLPYSVLPENKLQQVQTSLVFVLCSDSWDLWWKATFSPSTIYTQFKCILFLSESHLYNLRQWRHQSVVFLNCLELQTYILITHLKIILPKLIIDNHFNLFFFLQNLRHILKNRYILHLIHL